MDKEYTIKFDHQGKSITGDTDNRFIAFYNAEQISERLDIPVNVYKNGNMIKRFPGCTMPELRSACPWNN